jgi:hypothetical protein
MPRVDRRTFLQGLGAATGAMGLAGAARAGRPAALDRLRAADITVGARAAPWGADVHDGAAVELLGASPPRRQLPTGALDLRAAPVPGDPDAVDLFATFRARAGAPAGWLAVQLDCGSWSVENYLLLPGCCYAGNRFESRFAAYPPLLTEPADIGPHVPPIITDIPRLNRHAGPSRLEVATADLATGALAMFAPALHLGLILLVDAMSAVGPTGLTVAEGEDRRRALLHVSTPFVRHPGRGGSEAHGPPPAPPRPGQSVTLRARLLAFPCEGVPVLLARLFSARKALNSGDLRAAPTPLSAVFADGELAASARWVEKPGLLAIGDRASAYTTWQNGWCGGFGLTWPLLVAGSAASRERAVRTTDFALTGGQGPTGFFHGLTDGTHWYDDGFTAPLPGEAKRAARGHPRWHLVRRTADSLFYLLDQLTWLESPRAPRDGAGVTAATIERWSKAARLAADALARLWERHRQFGQMVDVETGDLIVGGSSSAGLAPAALVRAADRFKEARYREVALESGRAFFDRFVAGGLTCGGPGDALQCPDSESAAALVESFMSLFEATGDRTWVERARTAAHLLATWVVSGDGEGCPVARVRMIGAVIPDAQNHAPQPGLVLLAGDALLRLARATGERGFLELLRDIVRQVARPGAPCATSRAVEQAALRSAPSARLRAEIVPDGLADAVKLLTATRVPGVYAQIDKGLVFAFDAVEARVKERMPGRLVLSVRNLTEADASVRVMAEMASDAERPLAPGAVLDALTVAVPAGRSVDVVVPPVAR